MIILYAADANFRDLLDLSIVRTHALGYTTKDIDLGGLGVVIYKGDLKAGVDSGGQLCRVVQADVLP